MNGIENMIAIIVAYAHNRVIGYKGRIPWKIPEEQRLFKELTVGNIVIMGRISYEEIGRPLPDRITIVVSNSKKYSDKNLYSAKSLIDAIELANKLDANADIYISGGYSIYKEGIDYADILYITEIDMDVEGDTFFPELDSDRYIITELNHMSNAEVSFTQYRYDRI